MEQTRQIKQFQFYDFYAEISPKSRSKWGKSIKQNTTYCKDFTNHLQYVVSVVTPTGFEPQALF
ncbi:MAG: hypothetical protein IJQ07_05845 [Clostridia bacterium]|nr:hypothetical protein [Clostridia bacterium]